MVGVSGSSPLGPTTYCMAVLKNEYPVLLAATLKAKQKDYSALAQLVEQMTVNHWVAGSSPASGAKF